jgi:ubiquitin carboxyl-terminal hydrolase 4/11/15
MTTVNPQDLEELPAYQAHEESEDAALPLLADVEMNDGLRPSIEEDEGIDMDFRDTVPNYSSLNSVGLGPSWNFDSLPVNRSAYISGTGSANDVDSPLDGIDAGSDIVNEGSSASSGSRRGRLEDFDNAIVDDTDYEPPKYVPDMEEPDQLDEIFMRAAQGMPAAFNVSVQETDEIEEPATEIHVEEGEGIKLD